MISLSPDTHVIFSCEGTAEEVVIRKLLKANRLVFRPEDVVAITRWRRAADIESRFLQVEYDWPVIIVRVLDSPRERFKLGSLYRDRYQVMSVLTRPEIEMLAILKEGALRRYEKSGLRPSSFCKGALRLPRIKERTFLESYWTADEIVNAAREYARIHRRAGGELCLFDIIAG